MPAKTERFELRLEPETIEQVDQWRGGQPDLPTRAEAVRRLILAGLSPEPPQTTKFSAGERLMLFMLSDMAKQMRLKGEINADFVQRALTGGHYWGFDWQYPGIFHQHADNPDVVREVVDILDMWDFIETSYAKLSKKDKDRVGQEAEPFGTDVQFLGFDGNNESSHVGIAHFLTHELDRFSLFKNRALNSHMPSLTMHRRMLAKFQPMRGKLAGGHLSVTQIIELLLARAYKPAPSAGNLVKDTLSLSVTLKSKRHVCNSTFEHYENDVVGLKEDYSSTITDFLDRIF